MVILTFEDKSTNGGFEARYGLLVEQVACRKDELNCRDNQVL